MAAHTQNATHERALGTMLRGCVILMILILVAAAFNSLLPWADQSYVVKSKLTEVTAFLGPIKLAVETEYQRSHHLPMATTVVTPANAGAPATPDWAALGFTTLPAVPPEVTALWIGPDGDIVVVVDGIQKGIDGTQLHARAVRDATGTNWTYACTSGEKVMRRYFQC